MRIEGDKGTREQGRPFGRKTEEPEGTKKAGLEAEGRQGYGRTDSFLNKETVQYRLGRGRENVTEQVSESRGQKNWEGRNTKKKGVGTGEERKEKSRAGKVRCTSLGA